MVVYFRFSNSSCSVSFSFLSRLLIVSSALLIRSMEVCSFRWFSESRSPPSRGRLSRDRIVARVRVK
jgi:hypothetical protein